MSVKLYGGLRVKKIKTISQLNSFSEEVRSQVKVLTREFLMRRTAKLLTEIVDNSILDISFPGQIAAHYNVDKEEGVSFLVGDDWMLQYQVINIIELRHKRSERLNCRDVDFSIDFTMMVYKGRSGVLLYPFTERKEFKEILLKMEGVEPYGYWDSIDRPKGVTYRQWKARGEEWLSAVGDGPLKSQGFCVDFADDRALHFIPYMEEREEYARFINALLNEYMPSVYDRALVIAKKQVLGEKAEELKALKPDNYTFSPYLDAMDWMVETEEGKAELLKRQMEITKILPHDLSLFPSMTVGDFKAWVKDYADAPAPYYDREC